MGAPRQPVAVTLPWVPWGTSGPSAKWVAVMDCGRYGKYFVCSEKFWGCARSVTEN